MTWDGFVVGVLLLGVVAAAIRAFFRGARQKREASAYAARQHAVRTPPITKHIYRFPAPRSENASPGVERARDETIGRDQVSRPERMGRD